MKPKKIAGKAKQVSIARSTSTGKRLKLVPKVSSRIRSRRSITFDFLLTTQWIYLLRIDGSTESEYCGACPISLEEFLSFETLYDMDRFQMNAVIRTRATLRKEGRYRYERLEEEFGSVVYHPTWPGGEAVGVLLGNIFPPEWDGKYFDFVNLGIIETLEKQGRSRVR